MCSHLLDKYSWPGKWLQGACLSICLYVSFSPHICTYTCFADLDGLLLNCLFFQFSTQPFPPPFWVSISTQVPLKWQCRLVVICRAGSRSQGWHGTSLLCLNFCRAPTNLWWHQFPNLSMGDKFKHMEFPLPLSFAETQSLGPLELIH